MRRNAYSKGRNSPSIENVRQREREKNREEMETAEKCIVPVICMDKALSATPVGFSSTPGFWVRACRIRRFSRPFFRSASLRPGSSVSWAFPPSESTVSSPLLSASPQHFFSAATLMGPLGRLRRPVHTQTSLTGLAFYKLALLMVLTVLTIFPSLFLLFPLFFCIHLFCRIRNPYSPSSMFSRNIGCLRSLSV